MSVQCTGKAGANGYFKHVGALLYSISMLDFSESGLKQIPANTSCTERPQRWHKPAQRAPNFPILFKDILMIEHDYDADKRQTTARRIQRKNEKDAYLSCLFFALSVAREQTEWTCVKYSKTCQRNQMSNAVIINLLQGNNCEPVTNEKDRKCFRQTCC